MRGSRKFPHKRVGFAGRTRPLRKPMQDVKRKLSSPSRHRLRPGARASVVDRGPSYFNIDAVNRHQGTRDAAVALRAGYVGSVFTRSAPVARERKRVTAPPARVRLLRARLQALKPAGSRWAKKKVRRTRGFAGG